MIPAGSLRLIDGDGEAPPPPPAEEPKVFVRILTAPPGWPWEQVRSADLDARHGSPLPPAEVTYQVRRLGGWALGRPGRFAAFYVLAKSVGARLETYAQVDGEDVRVVFAPPAQADRRVRQLGAVGLAAGVVAFLAVAAVGMALGRRAELENSLEIAEQKAKVKLARSSERARLNEQARALRYRQDRGAPVQEVLADLAWISTVRVEAARVEAFHWDRGYVALEVRGDTPPLEAFTDETLERSVKPLRPGVWLWGVKRGVSPASATQPVAASPRQPGDARD